MLVPSSIATRLRRPSKRCVAVSLRLAHMAFTYHRRSMTVSNMATTSCSTKAARVRSTFAVPTGSREVLMRAFISVDMEGVAGIATIDQVVRGGSGYPRAQELMTEEANAAIRGAFAGGAAEVLVNDSHGT